MTNAYEFMLSHARREKVLSRGLADILQFDGPIMLDSGGFQYLKGKKVPYTAQELADFGIESGADFLFALDYPPRSYRQNFSLLARKNMRNFMLMSRKTDVIPIVHAPPNLAKKELKLLRRVNPPYVAVGGLVPSLRGAIKMTLETIELVQEELPDSRIHLMGFGATQRGSSYLKKAYSVDYGGWRSAAATSYLLTPNGYRKIGSRNKNGHAAKPNKNEKQLIRDVCKHIGLNRRSLPYDFGDRAIFNAFVAMRVIKAKSLW